MTTRFLFLFLILGFVSCDSGHEFDYKLVPTYAKSGNLNCVIEIPAGTNKKLEYDYDSNTFPCDIKNGRERVVQFMPYPTNYGFIPGTMMDEERGGDGDALDVFVIASSLATGTVVETKVVGVAKLLDEGEQDDKLIAIPVDEDLQIVGGNTIAEMDTAALEILKTWLLNYSDDEMIFQRWGEAEEAKDIVEKWRK